MPVPTALEPARAFSSLLSRCFPCVARGPVSGLLLLLPLLLLPLGCGRSTEGMGGSAAPQPADPTGIPQGRPKVLASFTVVADMAREVACGQLTVESITRPGAEIHGYEITPSDLRRARGTQLVLENGLGLDRWTHRFTAGLGNVPRVVVSQGVATLPIVGSSQADAVNPHAWMSPQAALTYVANIRDAFVELDPPRAATYRRCAAAYADRIRALDRELAIRLERLPPQHRLLVSCEGAFSYLTRDYGLDEAWLWPVNGEREVTPQRMQRLIATVRSRRARSHSRDKHAVAAPAASDTMHEELLASTPLDDSEDTTAPAAAPALTTRHKKAASAPVTPSFDQLEDDVQARCCKCVH